MPLMLINAPDELAVAAVRQLSRIQVLAVVANETAAATAFTDKPEMPRSWVGLLPKESGRRMLKEVADLRDEWERNT